MIGQVILERASDDLKHLSGDLPICNEHGCYTIQNRITGSEGLHWAKEYVFAELTKLNYSVEVQDWSLDGYVDQNIIARKAGKSLPGEEIIFLAHPDGPGTSVDGRFPAADDNGSGAVDLLEMARVLNN
jgi:Zn-dependent M28 family amino/carboxypeptidase